MGNKHSNQQANIQCEQKDRKEKNNKETKAVVKVPENAKTMIIVLGQRLLPTGKPNQWMIERVQKAYSLLIQHKLDISSTYFIVSGSDVSNFRYQQNNNGKIPDPKHISEAQMMYELLMDIHQNKHENKDNNDDFATHILLEHEAMTTIQNFYYIFQMIANSNMRNKIETIYVVTSDFHLKRAKYYFDTMFFNEKQQIIGNSKDFKYEENVHWITTETNWNDENEKSEKLAKEEKYYNIQHLQQQTIITAKKLWMTLK